MNVFGRVFAKAPPPFPVWPRRTAAVAAALILPLLVAESVRDMATLDWGSSQARLERLGPKADMILRNVSLIERASYASSDPNAAFESTIPGDTIGWRYVSRGAVAFTFLSDWVSGTIPRQSDPDPTPYDGKARNGTYSFTRVGHSGMRLAIEFEGVECKDLLFRVSDYTISRMRAAWDIARDDLDIAPDTAWGAVGEASATCREGSGQDKPGRRFLLRFEPPAAATLHQSGWPG